MDSPLGSRGSSRLWDQPGASALPLRHVPGVQRDTDARPPATGHHDREIGLTEAARGARIFLAALGVDVHGDGLHDTPLRMARAGYLPGERVLGLSKLARVVELFANNRPQVQERLTQQVANRLQPQLTPRGIGVILEAEHSCMTHRGVRTSPVKSAPLRRGLRTVCGHEPDDDRLTSSRCAA